MSNASSARGARVWVGGRRQSRPLPAAPIVAGSCGASQTAVNSTFNPKQPCLTGRGGALKREALARRVGSFVLQQAPQKLRKLSLAPDRPRPAEQTAGQPASRGQRHWLSVPRVAAAATPLTCRAPARVRANARPLCAESGTAVATGGPGQHTTDVRGCDTTVVTGGHAQGRVLGASAAARAVRICRQHFRQWHGGTLLQPSLAVLSNRRACHTVLCCSASSSGRGPAVTSPPSPRDFPSPLFRPAACSMCRQADGLASWLTGGGCATRTRAAAPRSAGRCQK